MLIFIPFKPLSTNNFAFLSKWYPFVVITTLFILFSIFKTLTISKKSFLTVGSPPVILILETPNSEKHFARRLISSRCKIFCYHFYLPGSRLVSNNHI